MMRRHAVLLLLFLTPAIAGCSRGADLATAAKIGDVTTGWFDAGITEDGKNKLVPSVSFRIRNAGQATLGSTQLNLLPAHRENLHGFRKLKLVIQRNCRGISNSKIKLDIVPSIEMADFA